VRLRVAAPILLLSLCVMLAGLSLATAQQNPGRPNIDVSGPAARRLNLPPLSKLPGTPAAPTPAAPAPATPAPATPSPRPGTPVTPAPGPTPSPGPQAVPTPPPMSPTPPPMTPRAPITPFETGIEFEPMSPNARVTFNLEDADLPDLVRLISSITGKRFILPGSKARAIKATVYAPTKVTTAEAYQAFLSILQLNGMSVVPAGRYLKIVETTGIEGMPVATYTQGEATPADDRFITRMHHLENVPAEDVATLLGRFKSHEGNITAYAPTNTIILTDMGSSIRRMLRIVEAIDIPRAGEQVWLEPVHYADATEMATRLSEIFPVSEGGAAGAPAGAPRPATPAAPGPPGSPTADGPSTVGSRAGEMRITKILADERTNSLVIIATERAYLRILEMVRALDIPLEGEGRVHVHYVQHGDAEDIAQALTSIVGGGGGGAAPGGPPGAARPAGAAAAAGGGTPFEGSVRISAHKPTNSLVITSSLHDYATLRNVIGRLDVERRQVFIEAVIMELQVKRGTKAGLSLHTGLPDTPAAGALSLLGFNAGGSLAFPSPTNQDTLTGLALGVRGPAIQQATQAIGISIPAFGVVLNALSTTGDVNVLSTPHIMAMDNVEAEISVGADIPLQNEQRLWHSGRIGRACRSNTSSGWCIGSARRRTWCAGWTGRRGCVRRRCCCTPQSRYEDSHHAAHQ
jgi:general secretion pathway protein D